MSAVKCVYGSNIQDIAHMLDREWCEAHCDRKDRTLKHEANLECYRHLMEMGIDPANKKDSV